jgi:hypothetical protein
MIPRLGDNTAAACSIAAPPFDHEGMMKLSTHVSLLSASAMLSVIMMACAGDPPTVPVTAVQKVSTSAQDGTQNEDEQILCRISSSSPHVGSNSIESREDDPDHGHRVARFIVDKTSGEIGDGFHFQRIGDAIAAARELRVARGEQTTASCRIMIVVAPGIYRGSVNESADPTIERLPLVIDVPDLTLKGALAMQIDEGGRATGIGEMEEGHAEQASTLVPSPALLTRNALSEPIFVVNAHPDGFQGNGAIIEGFVFQSGHVGVDASFGGVAILSLRVRDLVVRGNRFEAEFSQSVDLRASSAHVNHNHLSGTEDTCDLCFAGPGDYEAIGNRLLAGGIPGILVTPATLLPVPPMVEQYTLPASATVSALLVNNEVRNHLRKPVGAGIRVGAIGVGAPNVAGLARVEARDNLLVSNTFAMIVEAAFPVKNTLLKGDIELTLHGNTFSASCQNHLLVSLSRHTTGLGLTNFPYLRSSHYTLTLGGDIAWGDVWYSHPAGFGNTLSVDGVQIPNGSRIAYDATRTCTP